MTGHTTNYHTIHSISNNTKRFSSNQIILADLKNNSEITGYLHQNYAKALRFHGEPVFLKNCEGWILKRNIPNTVRFDGMGCYPLFCCRNWANLFLDMENLKEEIISLSIVTDPFGQYDKSLLEDTFHDQCYAYKEHYIIDLHKKPSQFISAHHQKNIKIAKTEGNAVHLCKKPGRDLDDWNRLYRNLIVRHNIVGITAFSKDSFAEQLQVPGIKVFKAINNGMTTGMLLWYTMGEVAYYHLGAYSKQGYTTRASFALFQAAIEYFADSGTRWLSLGAGAGVTNDAVDGLSRFKRGWATGTRSVFFGGKIFDQRAYDKLSFENSSLESNYFPAYRKKASG